MWREKLKPYRLILASGSPRRQEFFSELGLDFDIVLKPIQEEYPEYLEGSGISEYLARLKAAAFSGQLHAMEILITSDTVVWHRGTSLAKPKTKDEAIDMIRTLSNDWHQVITSVCLTTVQEQRTVSETTQVKFGSLSDAEIDFYVENYKPYDKAGGYGIQEWIGLIGIEEIRGSYTNVVGLPTQLTYKTLMAMVD